MVSKKYFLIPSLILLTFLLSSAALALSISTEDSEKTICIGSTAVILDKVSGASGQSTVNASGTATAFTTTVPTEFSGTNQNIYSYVTISSKTKPGAYDLKVKVTSGNSTKEQTHEITAKDCHGTSLIVDSDKNACPCEKVKYRLKLENQGEFTENFIISVEGTAKQWTNLSISSSSLKTGEIEEFYAYVQTPCNVDGEYTLTFKAIAEQSLAGASAAAKLNILACYEYTLSAKSNYSICENENLTVSVKIDNKGTANNTFNIVFEGPKWAVLSSKFVDASAESEKTFDINVLPPFKTEGNFTLKIETMTSAGNVKKSVLTNLKVRRCYGSKIEMQSEDKLCKEEKEYNITVINLGEIDSKYTLSVEGPEWAELSDDIVKVDAKKNKTIALKVTPKKADYKKYDITVTAKDTISGDENSKTLSLELPKPEECRKSEITSKEDSINVEIEKSKTLFLMLKNKGFEENEYNIEISGNGAKFSLINPNEVTLKPGDSETLYLYISPPLFTETGEYNITVIAEEKNSDITSEKEIIANIVKEGSEEAKEAEETTTETAQPNIFVRIISAIKNFFSKLFMVQPIEINETESNISVAKEPETLQALDVNEIITNGTESNITEIETIEIGEVNATADETEESDASAEEENNESDEIEAANITEDDLTAKVIDETQASNESEKIEKIADFNEKAGDFFQTYKTYIIGAVIVLLIILIIISGIGKSIIEFFEEEETSKK